MPSKTLVLAAAALAILAPTALAGQACIENQCAQDVWLWSVADVYNVAPVTLATGKSYSEEYRINKDGGGVSMKLSLSDSQDCISQFEYTLTGSMIFYDISNINGYPFKEHGMTLSPSDSSCPQVVCP